MKKLSVFNMNFWNSFQDLLFWQVLRSSSYIYWNGGSFDITHNLEKNDGLFNVTQKLEKKRYLQRFDEAIPRKFMEKLSFFNKNFQSSYKYLEYWRFSRFLTFCY